MVVENSIESQYRELEKYLTSEYIELYKDFSNSKLQEIFSSIHSLLTQNYKAMNTRLPTEDETNYFWAENSRELILAIDAIESLHQALRNTLYSFEVDDYYKGVIEQSKTFLKSFRGSEIPPHMKKVELYYTIPIFKYSGEKHIEINAPKLKAVDQDYIKTISARAMADIEKGDFDSAISKARTLLESVLAQIIERKSQTPLKGGNLNRLYKQAKDLYNMHSDDEVNLMVRKLVSGLTTIVESISEMRNKCGDAHGVEKRIAVCEYHARLVVNSALVVAEFMLSVEERANSSEK